MVTVEELIETLKRYCPEKEVRVCIKDHVYPIRELRIGQKTIIFM